VQEQEIELAVGDVVQIGQYTVTVIDIDGPEVSFRIDSSESDEFTVEDNQPVVYLGK
jgi:hypothetical protein